MSKRMKSPLIRKGVRRRALKKQEREGASMVEFALVLPVFLLFTLSILDWSYVFYQYHFMYKAASESARSMAIQEMSPEDAAALAKETLGDPDVTSVDTSITDGTGTTTSNTYTYAMSNDRTAIARISVPYIRLSLGVSPLKFNSVNLIARVEVPVEGP